MAPSADTLLSSGYNEITADEKQDTVRVDDTLTHGLSGPEVHRRALEARKLFGKAQKALAFWINEIDARKIYREFGCSSIYHYATSHLALGEHTIAEMLRTGKALEHLPLLSQAYEEGEISSTHVREITRVATPETESFWYKVAKKSTTRQIEKLVAFSPKGGLPPAQIQLPVQTTQLPQGPNLSQKLFLTAADDKPLPAAPGDTALPAVTGDTLLPTAPGGTVLRPAGLTSCDLESQNINEEIHLAKADERNHQAERNQQEEKKKNAVTEPTGSVTAPVKYHDKLIVELSGEEMSIVKDALDRARKESGLRDRKSLLLFIVKSFLDGTATSGRENRKPPYQILLHHHLPSGLTWSDTMKGEMPVSPNVLEKALCDAEIIEVDEPDRPIKDLPECPARDLHEGEKAEGAGRESSGRESSGRESSGRESSGRESSGRESSGRESSGRESSGRESSGRESSGRESSGRESSGRESSGRESSGRESSGRESSSRESSSPSKDGLSRVNRLYKIYKERRSRKPENRDKSSDGNDMAPVGRRRRAVKTEKTIPDAMRKKVLKRDGHKCQRPGCERTFFLEVHHIEPEGAGGATEENNLCTACAFCHDLVHKDRLSVEGEAPHQLIWRDERGQII
ncbi:MAG: HNH endonuclease [Vulcanimicrobiota bacterium]